MYCVMVDVVVDEGREDVVRRFELGTRNNTDNMLVNFINKSRLWLATSCLQWPAMRLKKVRKVKQERTWPGNIKEKKVKMSRAVIQVCVKMEQRK